MDKTRNIRIAHVTTVDLSLHYLMLNQLISIQAEGYDVVGISNPGSEVPIIEAAGIPHYSVTITRHISPLQDLRALWQLYRLYRREKFTIVHTHTPKAGLLGQLAAKLAGVPIIFNTLHGFYFHENMSRRKRQFYILMEKVAALCSTRILSQNQEDIDTALRHRIAPQRKLKYLGNGIDMQRFVPSSISSAVLDEQYQRLGISPDAPVIGFVGRLAARRKGFLDFLRAAQQILHVYPDARFLIIGESDIGKPDAVDPIIASEMGIADACHFLGKQPNDMLPVFYKMMTMLVLPSEFEGFPRVIMEASAMGVPVVASDVKGNREAVHVGKNGVLTPYADPQKLAETIVSLLNDPDKCTMMGQMGREIALQHFDEQKVFETVKCEYARILQERGFKTMKAVTV